MEQTVNINLVLLSVLLLLFVLEVQAHHGRQQVLEDQLHLAVLVFRVVQMVQQVQPVLVLLPHLGFQMGQKDLVDLVHHVVLELPFVLQVLELRGHQCHQRDLKIMIKRFHYLWFNTRQKYS